MTQRKIEYPFLPAGKIILYVPAANKYMKAAKDFAKNHSLDKFMPTGSVVVLDGKVIGRGSNGSDYHEKYGCERVKKGIPTGEGYELCEGCHPKNHSEPRAIEDALRNHSIQEMEKAELYLWGHWWACEPCWNSILSVGIKKVYLEEDSQNNYNKLHPHNLVGQQFA